MAAVAYDDNDQYRNWPYIIAEFAERGNLNDYFRYKHRNAAKPALLADINLDYLSLNIAGPSKVTTPTKRIPWVLKLGMSFTVADALHMLHYFGVAHGDVKFSNVVATKVGSSGKEGVNWKLCDFGSSILLLDARETDEDPKPYRLKSRMQPWKAPEVEEYPSVDGAIKTYIYSFGLVFARIMFNGHGVFDSSHQSAGNADPGWNQAFVDRLRAQDLMYEHAMSRIESLSEYTEEELAIIRRILQCTLRTDPSMRLRCLTGITLDLGRASATQFIPLRESCFSWESGRTQIAIITPIGLPEPGWFDPSKLPGSYLAMREVLYSLEAIASSESHRIETPSGACLPGTASRPQK